MHRFVPRLNPAGFVLACALLAATGAYAQTNAPTLDDLKKQGVDLSKAGIDLPELPKEQPNLSALDELKPVTREEIRAEEERIKNAPPMPALPPLPQDDAAQASAAAIAPAAQNAAPALPALPPVTPQALNSAAVGSAVLSLPELPGGEPPTQPPSIKAMDGNSAPAPGLKDVTPASQTGPITASQPLVIPEKKPEPEVSEEEEEEVAEPPKRKMVWRPKFYKKYILPSEIYRKEYDINNEHLPKAMYQQEWEALLFNACANNDLNSLRALLASGVSIESRNGYGDTPLIYAAKAGAEDVVRVLLARGAHSDATNRRGMTALDAARRAGKRSIVSLLLIASGNAKLAKVVSR